MQATLKYFSFISSEWNLLKERSEKESGSRKDRKIISTLSRWLRWPSGHFFCLPFWDKWFNWKKEERNDTCGRLWFWVINCGEVHWLRELIECQHEPLRKSSGAVSAKPGGRVRGKKLQKWRQEGFNLITGIVCPKIIYSASWHS